MDRQTVQRLNTAVLYEDHPRAIRDAISEADKAQAKFAANQEAERKRLVKLCNVARSDRGWDDDEWAAIKLGQGGAESLSDMDITDLEAVLDHAKKCGFKVRHKMAGGKKSRAIDQTDPARKLRKLWLRGHALGIIQSADESALCSWASNKRSQNVTALLESFGPKDWDAAIERLKKWLYREIMQGKLVCPACKRASVPDTPLATSLIWEKPISCSACLPARHLMVWNPKVSTAKHGRRG